MFRVECIPSLSRLLPVSTPLTQVIYSPCIHHTHAFVVHDQRKCQLIYSRHLLWEYSLLTEDKSTGAAHLLLLSFLPYPKIYTWRYLNLLTRSRSYPGDFYICYFTSKCAEIYLLIFSKWIYLFNFCSSSSLLPLLMK